MKKFLSIALALLMVCVMLPVVALAADTLPAPDANGVITLAKDITLSGDVTFTTNTTIDLGGNTLTAGYLTVKNGASLTLKNGTVKAGVWVYGGDTTTTLNVESDATIISSFCVVIEGGNKATTGTYGKSLVNIAGTINSTSAGVWVMGNLGDSADAIAKMSGKSDNIVNIKSTAKISGTEGAVLMGYATMNIENGAEITGVNSAVFVKRGQLNVNGGTLTATGASITDRNPEANNNGTEDSIGAAIAITATYNYSGDIDVNINGGTFKSTNGNAVYVSHTDSNGQNKPFTNGVDVDITGGTFTSAEGKPSVLIQDKIEGDAASYDTNKASAVTGGTYSNTTGLEELIPAGSGLVIKDGKVEPKTITIIVPGDTTPAETPKTEDQKNPTTGANDFVGLAAAAAVVALLGSAVVLRKK